MKLKDYVPHIYKYNLEMNTLIEVEENEIENVKSSIRISFLNTFANTANEEGIQQFEKLLGILSSTGDKLQFRKERVLNRLSSKPPFTEKYLQNLMNTIIGEGNWEYNINYNNYSLVIRSLKPGDKWLYELTKTLESIIPVNIDWTIEMYSVNWKFVIDTYETWNDITNMTWKQVKEGE